MKYIFNKNIVLVLAVLFITSSYSFAQSADIAMKEDAVKVSAQVATSEVKEKIDYEAVYSKIPEIREINKKFIRLAKMVNLLMI
ncbi:MAG: hypothetical protein IJ677_07570 [Alphaproteobacteria bacterium]|nr:hypothetical protein [Alphaproteobacteria bacterium]